MISNAKRLFVVNYIESHTLFAALAILAVLARVYDVNFILGISYSFSSLFLMLIIKLFGINHAVITAVAAQFVAALVLDHPGLGIISVLEVIFIGFITIRKLKVNIVFGDIVFWIIIWIFIGLPIFAFAYYSFFNDGNRSVLYLQAGKDLTSGILNCVLADVLLTYMPFPKWIKIKSEKDSTIKFHKFLFHVTSITIISTFMVSFIISSNNAYYAMKRNAENLAVKYVENIEQEINQWDNVETNQLILLGNLQVARLEQYINRVASDGELEVIVTNPQHKVITSNVSDYKFKQIYDWRFGGRIDKVTDKLYKYLPMDDDSIFKIDNWSRGNYIYEKVMTSPAISIVVRAPIKKFQQEILKNYSGQIKLLIYFLIGSLMLGLLTNRFLVRTLKQLSIVTTGLPGKLGAAETIEWPSSRVSEIRQLIDNFKHMSDNLDVMFKESREMNTILASQAEKLQRSEERLHDLAYYDSLTKLPNRLTFKHYLTEKLHEARDKGSKVAVMFIDLNQFKQINDTMGHSVGDELLKVVGSRLQRVKNSKTEVFRLGGDEFVLVLCTDDEAEVQSTGETIKRFFLEPIELRGVTLNISGSIGISMFPKDGEDMDTLVRFADIAMYSSKRKGGSDIQFFSEDIGRDFKGY